MATQRVLERLLRIGIDLGGTKIEGALLGDDGVVRLRERHATPRGDYEATLRLIREIVRALEAHAGGPASVGVGIPGTICPVTHVEKLAAHVFSDRHDAGASARSWRLERRAGGGVVMVRSVRPRERAAVDEETSEVGGPAGAAPLATAYIGREVAGLHEGNVIRYRLKADDLVALKR